MSLPLPDNEEERLEALHRLNLLDTEPESLFDRITTLAQHIFGVSSAAVRLVDRDREWSKSMCGWETREPSHDLSFSTYAMLDNTVMVVEDTTTDDRFTQNPLVSEEDIQFYADAPLYLEEEVCIGILCLTHDQPRSFGDRERAMLAVLADVVELLEARRMTHQIGYLHSALEQARDAVLITEALRQSIQIGPHEVQITASVGGTIRLSSYATVDDALHVADWAMYEAKELSGQNAILWDPDRKRDEKRSPFPMA